MRRAIPDLVRYYKGYAAINQQQPIGWRTYHSIQISVNRRFRDGLLFGFNDTIGLSDKQNAATAPAAQRRRNDHDPGRPGPGRRVARRQPSAAASHAGAVRVGSAADLRRLECRPRARLHPERLEPVGHLVGSVGPGLRRDRRVPERRRQRRISPARPISRRACASSAIPARAASDDPLRQFNTGAFLGPVVGSDGLESGNGYLTRMLHQQHGYRAGAHDQAGRQPHAAVPRRRVQPVQSGGHHRAADAR